MTADQGFELHPDAAVDITDIWEFIAKDKSSCGQACPRSRWRDAGLGLPSSFLRRGAGVGLSPAFLSQGAHVVTTEEPHPYPLPARGGEGNPRPT